MKFITIIIEEIQVVAYELVDQDSADLSRYWASMESNRVGSKIVNQSFKRNGQWALR